MTPNISNKITSDAIETALQRTDVQLKENQVVQIHVLDKLPDNQLVLFFKGNTFYASSNLSFEKGQTLLAKVKSMEPSLVFSFLEFASMQNNKPVETPLKNYLASLNIVPSEKNINAAKAFSSELLPLKDETFKDFLKQVNQLNLDSYEDLKSAAKIFKLSAPIQNNILQKFKQISSQITGEKTIDINTFTKNLSSFEMLFENKISPDLKNTISKLQNGIDDTIIRQENDSQTIFNNIQKSLTFGGSAYEKQILSSLSKNSFDKAAFNEKFPALLQMLNDASQNITKTAHSQESYKLQNSSILSTINEIKTNLLNLHEKIQPFIKSSPINLDSQNELLKDTLTKQLLNIIHLTEEATSLKNISLDPVFKNPKARAFLQSFINDFKSEIMTVFTQEKLNNFKNLFKALDKNIPLQKQIQNNSSINDLVSSYAKDSAPAKDYFRHPALKTPLNIKEELLTLQDQLKSYIGENSNISQKAKNIQEESNNLINQLYRQQLNNLSNMNSNEFNQLNLFFMGQNDQLKELPVFFKKQTISKNDGTPQNSFLVLFAMELSNLGYFEVNILDQNQNLDITFFSEDSNVRNIFENNQEILEGIIKSHVQKKVSIKTSLPKKSGNMPLEANIKNQDFKNTQHLIDLIT